MPVLKTTRKYLIEKVSVQSNSRQRIEIRLPAHIKKITAVLVTATKAGG